MWKIPLSGLNLDIMTSMCVDKLHQECCETWWFHYHALGLIFLNPDSEAGLSWWEDRQSNPGRKARRGSATSRTKYTAWATGKWLVCNFYSAKNNFYPQFTGNSACLEMDMLYEFLNKRLIAILNEYLLWWNCSNFNNSIPICWYLPKEVGYISQHGMLIIKENYVKRKKNSHSFQPNEK